MVGSYHSKVIDFVNLDCTLSNLATICVSVSRDRSFLLCTDGDEDFMDEIEEDMFCWPSIGFTPEAFVDRNSLLKSTNQCKSAVVIDGSQLHP